MKSLLTTVGLTILPAAANAATLCDTLADAQLAYIRSHPGEIPKLETIPALAAPGAELAVIEAADEGEMRAELKRRLNAVGPVFNELGYFTRLNVTRVGQTGPIALWDVQGTAHCSYYEFLISKENAPPTLGPKPPQLEEEGMGACMVESWVGDLAGQPVYAMQSYDYTAPSLNISVAPWEKDHWGEICETQVDFEPIFRVVESNLPVGSWPELLERAPELAAQAHRGTLFEIALIDDYDAARFVRMKELAGKLETLPLVSEDRAFSRFEADAEPFALNMGGKTYLAKISHATLGWRVNSEFLLGLWDLDGEALKPVAGVVIETETGPLTRFTVSRVLDVRPEPQP